MLILTCGDVAHLIDGPDLNCAPVVCVEVVPVVCLEHLVGELGEGEAVSLLIQPGTDAVSAQQSAHSKLATVLPQKLYQVYGSVPVMKNDP